MLKKNIYKEFDGNSPVIYANKGFDPKSVNVLKTDAPLVADKLYQLKTQIWNEALTYLGISNINVQKKERLLQDEVTRNLGGTIASRYPRLEARKQACQQINKMFELNIDSNKRINHLLYKLVEKNTSQLLNKFEVYQNTNNVIPAEIWQNQIV